MPNPDPTPEEVEAQMETARAYFATRGFTSADHDITRNIEALALLLATEVKKARYDAALEGARVALNTVRRRLGGVSWAVRSVDFISPVEIAKEVAGEGMGR